METTIDPYVSIRNGIEVPTIIHKGDSIYKLVNKDSHLILKDQEDNELVVYDKQLVKLKGVCYQGQFVLAGKTTSNRWEILKQEKIDRPVQKWTLSFDKDNWIQLSFTDPSQIIKDFKRGRAKSSEDNTCSMCLELLDESVSQCVTTNCGHQFHKKCLLGWVVQNSCPNCRSQLIRKKNKRT